MSTLFEENKTQEDFDGFIKAYIKNIRKVSEKTIQKKKLFDGSPLDADICWMSAYNMSALLDEEKEESLECDTELEDVSAFLVTNLRRGNIIEVWQDEVQEDGKGVLCESSLANGKVKYPVHTKGYDQRL